VQKKHTTRRIIRETQERTRHVAGVDELELKKEARLERLELTNAWDAVDSADVAHVDDDSDQDIKRRKKAKEVGRRPAKSLAKILLADEAEQRRSGSFVQAMVLPSRHPSIPVCNATGRVGKYCDPASQLRYADRRALATLRETTPAWVKTTPVAPYWDAIKIINEASMPR